MVVRGGCLRTFLFGHALENTFDHPKVGNTKQVIHMVAPFFWSCFK